jgi:glycosyltransferase involved in cell wall biosynthesis
MMVGIYSYWPNQDGAQWFVQDVWPTIRRSQPDARLWIVGPDSDALALRPNDPPGVEVIGFQPDLEPLYRDSSVVICPIRFGGGTRFKLVEAAMYAKAIVSTTVGAEGLPLRRGESIEIADTSSAFAIACLELAADAERARAIGAAARDVALRLFSLDAVVVRASEEFRRCALTQAPRVAFTRR